MEHPLEMPVFPLGSVLFPAGRLALRIFEPRYVEMTRACIRDGSPFGVSLIRAGYEVGQPAIPCEVGCTARIVEWKTVGQDRFALQAQGESKFRIRERRATPAGLIVARVELVEPADPLPLPERHAAMKVFLQRLQQEAGPSALPQPLRLDDAAWVGNRIAELLPVAPERKQRVLESDDPLAALDEIGRWIGELLQDPPA